MVESRSFVDQAGSAGGGQTDGMDGVLQFGAFQSGLSTHTHTEGADTFLPDRFVNALLCLRAMRCVLLFLDMNTI